jgi:LPXTG-motif cell wall-anchored protein
MVVERNNGLGATSLPGIGMILAGMLALVLAGFGVSSAGATQPNPEHQVTLCHRTDSYSNPYVEITVDVASVLNTEGHDSHNGPVFYPEIPKHTEWGDIIPAFDFGPGEQYAGKNLPEGQAILDAGCVVESATTTTSESTTSTSEGSTTTSESTTSTTEGSTTTEASTTTSDSSTTTSTTDRPITTEATPVSDQGITTGSSTSTPVQGAVTPVEPGGTRSGTLPLTGSPVFVLLGVGVALIGSGIGLVLRRRRLAG